MCQYALPLYLHAAALTGRIPGICPFAPVLCLTALVGAASSLRPYCCMGIVLVALSLSSSGLVGAASSLRPNSSVGICASFFFGSFGGRSEDAAPTKPSFAQHLSLHSRST